MVQIPSPQPKNPTRKGWIFLLCQYFKFSVVEGYEDDERGSLGIEPDRRLWRKKGRRRVVQRSKSEMRMHRVFGYRKRHFSDNAIYCPYRPDLDEVVKGVGKSEGRTGTYNQWVIDNLM